LERASAQENRKTGKGFGSGRSENWKGLRLRKIGRLEGASAQEDRKVERRHNLASIKKGGSRRPVTGGQQQRAENRVKLERPRRICSPPSAEFRYFYGEEA